MTQIEKFKSITDFIKAKFPNENFIPLHAPVFIGKERSYVLDAIDSTFVSSVGEYVNRFEDMMCFLTGAKYAVAIVNGTNALHMGLMMAGVNKDDEVLSQSLTFVATCNAISYIGATPIFIDVDKNTLGMSPQSLSDYLETNAEVLQNGFTYNKLSGKRIKACVPMHTFGFPCKIDEIVSVCKKWNISLVEDAAESLGSYYKDKHTGTYGTVGIFSFNGNKIVTCGGGGALITDDENIAKKAKHLTTQAKLPHSWEFNHDSIGYNYRMPNLNAALACAQLEQLEHFVENKRELARQYQAFFCNIEDVRFFEEPPKSKANYWLNTILLNDLDERNLFLEYSNTSGVMTRPAWNLMHLLPMFKSCLRSDMKNSEYLYDRIVNIPSSVRPDINLP